MINTFFQIKKVESNEDECIIYLTATSEEKDAQNQIMDYDSSKPNFIDWSETFYKNSFGKSYGNLRLQHRTDSPIGKILKPLEFDDTIKEIRAVVKVIDDNAKKLVEEGVLTGASIGGKYGCRPWYDSKSGAMRYTVIPTELSLVDKPCNPSATFILQKADGSQELKNFKTIEKEIKTMENFELIKTSLTDEVKKVDDIKKSFEGTDSEKRERIRGAISNKVAVSIANSEKDIYFYVESVYEDRVIFTGNFDGDDDYDTYMIGYEITADGEVKLIGSPVQVRQEYVPTKDEDSVNTPLAIVPDSSPAQENIEKVEEIIDNCSKADNSKIVEENLENVEKQPNEELVEKTETIEKINDQEINKVETLEKPTDEKVEETLKTSEDYIKKTVEDQIKIFADEVLSKINSALEKVNSVEKSDNSMDTLDVLKEISHKINELGASCSCEKCSGSVQKADSEVQTINSEKFGTVEKAILDLSSKIDGVVEKVEKFASLPNDNNSPVVFETPVVQKVEVPMTSSERLSATWQEIQNNPVQLR